VFKGDHECTSELAVQWSGVRSKQTGENYGSCLT